MGTASVPVLMDCIVPGQPVLGHVPCPSCQHVVYRDQEQGTHTVFQVTFILYTILKKQNSISIQKTVSYLTSCLPHFTKVKINVALNKHLNRKKKPATLLFIHLHFMFPTGTALQNRVFF